MSASSASADHDVSLALDGSDVVKSLHHTPLTTFIPFDDVVEMLPQINVAPPSISQLADSVETDDFSEQTQISPNNEGTSLLDTIANIPALRNEIGKVDLGAIRFSPIPETIPTFIQASFSIEEEPHPILAKKVLECCNQTFSKVIASSHAIQVEKKPKTGKQAAQILQNLSKEAGIHVTNTVGKKQKISKVSLPKNPTTKPVDENQISQNSVNNNAATQAHTKTALDSAPHNDAKRDERTTKTIISNQNIQKQSVRGLYKRISDMINELVEMEDDSSMDNTTFSENHYSQRFSRLSLKTNLLSGIRTEITRLESHGEVRDYQIKKSQDKGEPEESTLYESLDENDLRHLIKICEDCTKVVEFLELGKQSRMEDKDSMHHQNDNSLLQGMENFSKINLGVEACCVMFAIMLAFRESNRLIYSEEHITLMLNTLRNQITGTILVICEDILFLEEFSPMSNI